MSINNQQALKAEGVRSILQKLRGSAPKPASPEDDVEALFSKEGTVPNPEEDEQALSSVGFASPESPLRPSKSAKLHRRY